MDAQLNARGYVAGKLTQAWEGRAILLVYVASRHKAIDNLMAAAAWSG